MPNNNIKEPQQVKETNPYNFVPLNENVLIPYWAEDISQDVPSRDGEDGTIKVTFRNVTPLFIKNGMRDKDKNGNYIDLKDGDPKFEDKLSAHIKDSDNKRHYFLPATSIKGMIRSAMEVLTFGVMDQYDNDSFSYRNLDDPNYRNKMQSADSGWLEKIDGNKYRLNKCKSENILIIELLLKKAGVTISEKIQQQLDILKKTGKNVEKGRYVGIFHKFGLNSDEENKIINYLSQLGNVTKKEKEQIKNPLDQIDTKFILDLFDKNLKNEEYSDGKFLVCTGPMTQKKFEYLFSTDKLEKIFDFDEDQIKEAFFNVYNPKNKYQTCEESKKKIERLFKKNEEEQGHGIPVFFVKDDARKYHIGFSRYFRLPCKCKVKDGVNQTFSDGVFPMKKDVDMVKCIFGRIKDGASLRGRVQFGNAFTSYFDDKDLVSDENELEGILGQPKSSFYPYYLKQGKGHVISYDGNGTDPQITISGRKFYRIQSGFDQNKFKNPKNKMGEDEKLSSNMSSRIRPIPEGKEFEMTIHLHNMRPIETGALLSALTFHGENGCFHNIGMAKSFGFGKIRTEIKEIKMEGKNKSKEDYLKPFENYMNFFTKAKMGQNWKETEQVKSLFSIASEHEDSLQFDTPEVYQSIKKNPRYDLNVQTSGIINQNDSFYTLICNLYYKRTLKRINNLISSSSFSEAISLCESSLLDFPLHKEELENLKKQINEKQFDNDVSVVRNLLSQGNFEEAIKRCDSMSLHYEDRQTEIDSIMLDCMHQKFAEDISFIREAVDSGNGDNDKALKMCNKIIKEEPILNEELSVYKKQLSARMAATPPDLSGIHDFNTAGKEILNYKKKAGDDLQPVIDLARQFLTSYKTYLVETANGETKEAKKAQGTLDALQKNKSMWNDNVNKWIGPAAAKQLIDELKNQ
jgi:CRISPR-associated protein (TIGR03986 family)